MQIFLTCCKCFRDVSFWFLGSMAGIQSISYEALVQEQWENFKLEHGKFYESETEDQYRRSVYMDNLQNINEHNKLYEHGLTSYKMGINYMADLSEEEFLRLYTSNIPELEDPENSTFSELWNLPQTMQDFYIFAPPISLEQEPDLPEAIDWRDKGAVTPVKDQTSNCASCWSFAATGALEAQWRLHKSNKLVSLSEQNLIDCSRRFGNRGCRGGEVHDALRYIKSNGGIDTEASYPYTAKDGVCKYSAANRGATVSQVVRIPKGEQQLKIKVGTVGPIAIAISVHPSFKSYSTGVYNEPKCRGRLDHALLAIGYGTEKGQDYWLVKNSWGTGWGDHGYIKMSRNKNNQCGIASWGSYPVV